MTNGYIRIPTQKHIFPTSDDDPLKYYYLPVTGYIYRRRLKMACDLLGPGPFNNLIEIGYGSGILLPELASRCSHLWGLDIHPQTALVEQMLEKERVQAQLLVGSSLKMPLPDSRLDAVVCLSVLEHLTEPQLREALAEIKRISTPKATIVLGFPVRNIVTDLFFRIVGFRTQDIHPSSHRDILEVAGRHLVIARSARLPKAAPTDDLSLYIAVRCYPRQAR